MLGSVVSVMHLYGTLRIIYSDSDLGHSEYPAAVHLGERTCWRRGFVHCSGTQWAAAARLWVLPYQRREQVCDVLTLSI